MFLRLLFVSLLLVVSSAQAAQKPVGTVVLVDELLFDLYGQGQTNYDFKIFEDLLKPMDRFFAESVRKSFETNAEFYLFSKKCIGIQVLITDDHATCAAHIFRSRRTPDLLCHLFSVS